MTGLTRASAQHHAHVHVLLLFDDREPRANFFVLGLETTEDFLKHLDEFWGKWLYGGNSSLVLSNTADFV